MTKAEEIIDNGVHFFNDQVQEGGEAYWCRKPIISAMQEHAIEFAEWCGNNSWIRSVNKNNEWRRVEPFSEKGKWVYKTTEELYNTFNNQTNQ